MKNIKFYGFIKVENGHLININNLVDNALHTEDLTMFSVTWTGDTPQFLDGLLEIVVTTEEESDQIYRGEWNG